MIVDVVIRILKAKNGDYYKITKALANETGNPTIIEREHVDSVATMRSELRATVNAIFGSSGRWCGFCYHHTSEHERHSDKEPMCKECPPGVDESYHRFMRWSS